MTFVAFVFFWVSILAMVYDMTRTIEFAWGFAANFLWDLIYMFMYGFLILICSMFIGIGVPIVLGLEAFETDGEETQDGE